MLNIYVLPINTYLLFKVVIIMVHYQWVR